MSKMKLLTSYLPEKIRSAVRFMVIGFTGSLVQTGFFLLAMMIFGEPQKGAVLYYVAFIIGFILEMIPNYICTNWYTFGTRPTLANAGGFVLARSVNLVIQLVLLPFLVAHLSDWRDDIISMIVIFIAGCINYLICLIFFNDKKEKA